MFSKQLKTFREKLKKSSYKFAKDNQLEPRTYANYENGSRLPNVAFLAQLSLKYDLNLNWLVLGEGNMLNTNSGESECYFFPVLGEVEASCGYGITVSDETTKALYGLSRQVVKDLGINPKQSEIIFASGNSMDPTIVGGDCLLVDKSKTEIYDGKIYCIRYDCQLYVKRLQKLPRKTIKVISDNKEQFDAFYIDFSKEIDIDFQIIGEVRWWGRIAK